MTFGPVETPGAKSSEQFFQNKMLQSASLLFIPNEGWMLEQRDNVSISACGLVEHLEVTFTVD